MENKIPTAREFFNEWEEKSGDVFEWELMMIEFAKIHVDEALEKAYENAEVIEGWNTGFSGSAASVDKDSILNAYPLSNVK